MSLETIARLEKLVDQLLAERLEMQARNTKLAAERDRCLEDRTRVSKELDKLLEKLEQLGGESQ